MSHAERACGPLCRCTLSSAVFLLSFLLLIGVRPCPVSGQWVPEGFSNQGIQIVIVDKSYVLEGNTARELLEQMQILRRSGRWVMFPWFSRWNYRTYHLTMPNGRQSTRCGIQDFEVRFEVEAVYPRWIPPDEPDEELVVAWKVYQDRISTYWEERRQYIITLARETSRRLGRLAEPCEVVGQRANDLVRDLTHRPDPEEEASIGDRPSLRLRWPPEGYEHLIRGPIPTNPQPRPTAVGRSPEEKFAEKALLDVHPSGMAGVVAGLQRQGEVEYLNAYGFSDADEEAPITPESRFRIPSFTEVAISALALRLAEEGSLDLEAPISTYLPGLDEKLGTVTLPQLLSHLSGIDDAEPRGEAWSEILDELDDRGIFTDPGAVLSFSRYDYPLAGRVLERIGGGPLEALLAEKVFQPLGMESTSLEDSVSGLPILQTTVPDVLRFWTAWAEGVGGRSIAEAADQRPGVPHRPGAAQPSPTIPASLLDARGRRFEGGVWRDELGGQPRYSLLCAAASAGDAVALEVVPESSLVFVLLAKPRALNRVWPTALSEILLAEVGSSLGVGRDILGPRRLRGDGEAQPGPRRCQEPTWNSERVNEPGSPAPSEEWAGRYLNGDRVFELLDRDGVLAVQAGSDLTFPVTHFGGDVYFATIAERPLWPFRLLKDAQGRRYAVVENRAHVRDADAPGG